ncbi:MAG: hypothetical protein CMG00_04435 [Candidatus Marinimicrobia bacterium]|nr:hypothetical protein [Candidatus Neomarinimicrobiota bacterium]
MIGINGVINFELSKEKIALFAESEINEMNNPELIYNKINENGIFLHLFNSEKKPLFQRSKNIDIYILGNIYDSENENIFSKIHRHLQEGDDRKLCSLNGIYSIIIINYLEKSFSIYLDDNALIPIYYKKVNKSLFISWNIFSLSNVNSTNSKINYENLFSWILIGGRGFNNDTRYKDIKRLEPGANIKFSKNKIEYYKNKPFSFKPSESTEKQLLENCYHSINNACNIRLRDKDSIALGLSGGIDSRLVFSSLVKKYKGNIYPYTYGPKNSIESHIAKQVCNFYGYKHYHINLDKSLFIDHARDGLFYSAGASLFKHGIQPHLFNSIKKESGADYLMLGSALDLVLGSTFSNDEVYKLKSKSQLLKFYQDNIFNFSLENFRKIFNNINDANHQYDYCYELLKTQIDLIEGDTIADINDALSFEVRIKRWYNYNLVYPLYIFDLLLPTYDNDFLKKISEVPSYLRKDSLFRIKLLNKLDLKVAEFTYDSTMQPAKLLPPETKKYIQKVKDEEKKLNRIWFDSEKTKYIPSNKYDANFLEWIRVYPEYQAFVNKVLVTGINESKNHYINKEYMATLIENHITGKQDLHKQLTMLMSSQIFLDLDNERDMKIKYNIGDLKVKFK